MKNERLQQFQELQNEVAAEATTILHQYLKIANEIDSDEAPFAGLEYSHTDANWIIYTGEETWNYGGHESHYFQLPINYLMLSPAERETDARTHLRRPTKRSCMTVNR